MDQQGLRNAIVRKLAHGLLPGEKCQMTWFGPGAGQSCACCDKPILATEVECECDRPSGGVIRFHQRCFALWDTLRQAER